MIYSISGKLISKKDGVAIIEAGGIGFKVFMPLRSFRDLPSVSEPIQIFCSLYNRENEPFELFGFLTEVELYLFDKLNTVSGIGPKTALGLLSVADINQLIIAINQGKTELLTRAAGIGKKTAERIVVELRGKLEEKLAGRSAAQTLGLMESDLELEETLISLGFNRKQAKEAISKIDPKITGFKERLKEALKKTQQIR